MALGWLASVFGYDLALDPGSESLKLVARGRTRRDGGREREVETENAELGTRKAEPFRTPRSAFRVLHRLTSVPSLVAGPLGEPGGFLSAEVAGSDALRYVRTAEGAGGRIRVVRPISRGVVADPAAAERLFRHALLRVPARAWGTRPSVILGLGAGISEAEAALLVEVLEAAGAGRVVPVPALAACALGISEKWGHDASARPCSGDGRPGYGQRDDVASPLLPQFPPGPVRLIIELGAERICMGLATAACVIAAGHVPLGFRDLDRALQGHLARRGVVLSEAGAESARRALGLPAAEAGPKTEDGRVKTATAQPPPGVNAVDPVNLFNLEAGATHETRDPMDDVLPRDVGRALDPFLAHVADETRRLLSRAPEGAGEEALSHGLVLAGRPAGTPGLAERLSRELGWPPETTLVAPDLRAEGLALLGGRPDLLAALA